MTDTENWAKAENPEVEQAKDAFAEAQAAQQLRTEISQHAAGAVKHGVDRDWANAWLIRLGATPITGRAEYRMNVPITGSYGWRCKANSRAEAVARFLEQVQRVASHGKITADGSYDNVYEVKFDEPVEPTDVVFYAGPEDPSTGTADDLDLDGLKAAIRAMVKEGVVRYGWNLGYARQALASMALDGLGSSSTKTVKVPVSGFTEVAVLVFEGDGDEAVQAAALGAVARGGNVVLKPDEVGSAVIVEAKDDEDDGGPF